jgi:hypothetical protein
MVHSSEGLGVIAVPTTVPLFGSVSQDRADKFCLGERVALLRLHGEAFMRWSELALERGVLRCHRRVATQVVAEREVDAFLLGPGDTEMYMVSARPTGWALEERVHEVEVSERKVRVAQVDQPPVVEISRFKVMELIPGCRLQAWPRDPERKSSRRAQSEAQGRRTLGGRAPPLRQIEPARRDRMGR